MELNTRPLQSSADSPASVPAAPSPLSQLHPDLVTELAWFLTRAAGWTPGDLDGLDGDPEFTAEVQAAMADLLAVSDPE